MEKFEGIILIDKPEDYTSFDVIARLRGMAKTKKVGHSGTLDPMATGVLPAFFGRAVKAVDMLPVQDKKYRATAKLGITTDTQDMMGKILTENNNLPSKDEIIKVINSFVGKQNQLPPMYSAVQVDGRRLYDLARQGIEVKREAREIIIHSIDILSVEDDEFTIDVCCSKGSFIRTLCHDIGEKLGCGAALSKLRRTMAAGFDICDCITLEEAQKLTEEEKLHEKLIPVDRVFGHLPKLTMTEKDSRHYLNGVKMTAKRFGVNSSTGDIAVYNDKNEFMGISYVNERGFLVSRKQFMILEG